MNKIQTNLLLKFTLAGLRVDFRSRNTIVTFEPLGRTDIRVQLRPTGYVVLQGSSERYGKKTWGSIETFTSKEAWNNREILIAALKKAA